MQHVAVETFVTNMSTTDLNDEGHTENREAAWFFRDAVQSGAEQNLDSSGVFSVRFVSMAHRSPQSISRWDLECGYRCASSWEGERVESSLSQYLHHDLIESSITELNALYLSSRDGPRLQPLHPALPLSLTGLEAWV